MMRHIFILFVFASTALQANERQETFLKAADLYEQGNVADALSLYQSIADKSPAILYNIGSCYYLLGNYPQALVAFRNAEQNADAALMKKLDVVIGQIKSKLGHSFDSGWYRAFLTLESYISVFVVQILLLFFLLLLVIWWWLRLSFRFKIVGLILITCMTGLFCSFDYWFASQQYAIVLQVDVPVFAGPNESFHKLFSLPAGAEVKVVEEQQSWYKVYGNGAYGWIEQKHLERLM